jgi:hypothetical protein
MKSSTYGERYLGITKCPNISTLPLITDAWFYPVRETFFLVRIYFIYSLQFILMVFIFFYKNKLFITYYNLCSLLLHY